MVPARLGEKFVQLGLWAFSELGGGGELEERSRKGALSCDRQEPGPARNPAGNRGRSGCGRNSRRLMSREQAQELHGLSAKPAASLDADNDEAASLCVPRRGPTTLRTVPPLDIAGYAQAHDDAVWETLQDPPSS